MRTDVASDGLIGTRRCLAILAVSAGTALAVIDATIPNVALPTIAQALGIEPREAVLVVTIYQLVVITHPLAMAIGL
jgi:DHA2 family multidrug resistance protein-like MFS transporter